jgi:hypothetical protein
MEAMPQEATAKPPSNTEARQAENKRKQVIKHNRERHNI